MTASKENDDTKITSSNSVKISEGNPNNIINGRVENNETTSVTSVKPSEPLEPSVKVLGES